MNLEEFYKKIHGHPYHLIYFSYPECPVCVTLLPKVEQLISRYPEVDFTYVNINESSEISGQHLVFTVPTLIIFKNGKEYKRFSRFVSMGELQQSLDLLTQEGIS